MVARLAENKLIHPHKGSRYNPQKERVSPNIIRAERSEQEVSAHSDIPQQSIESSSNRFGDTSPLKNEQETDCVAFNQFSCVGATLRGRPRYRYSDMNSFSRIFLFP